MDQKPASGESGAGLSETDKCTLTWGRRGVGQWRRTPRTSCSTRTAFHRPALPESESVPSPAPTAPRVPGDAAQRPPRAGALPNSPLGAGARPSARRTQPAATTVYSCGHAPAQLRRAFAFAPPLPPLPSLSLREEALRVLGSLLLYCAAQGYAFLF